MERFGLQAFMGEIMMVSFNFPPKGWAFCNGQFLPINQNQALFSLLGTTYGGNGQTNFALPDLRGRVPIHTSNEHPMGERAGEESHTVTINELPGHSHAFTLNNVRAKVAPTADSGDPLNRYFAITPALTSRFSKRADTLALANTITTNTMGGSQPHSNIMPSLSINFVIAIVGIFPSRN